MQAELYDEDIEFVNSDQGGFTFLVHRDALHAIAKGKTPESVASEAALYRYAWDGRSWMYCEQALPQNRTGTGLKGECTPHLPVTPDTSNADFSPFDRHRHD